MKAMSLCFYSTGSNLVGRETSQVIEKEKKILYKIKKQFESVNQEQKAMKKNKIKVKWDIWQITNNKIIKQKLSFVDIVSHKSPDSIIKWREWFFKKIWNEGSCKDSQHPTDSINSSENTFVRKCWLCCWNKWNEVS